MRRVSEFSWFAGLTLLAACGDTGSSDGPRQEATVAACQDGIDNDGDSWVDCDDQDCLVFVVCVFPPDAEQSDTVDPGTDVEDVDPDGSADAADDTGDASDAVDGADHDASDGHVMDTGSDTDEPDDAPVDTDVDTVDLDGSGDPGDGQADDGDTDADARPDPCENAELCVESVFTWTSHEDPVNGVPSSNTFLPLIGVETTLRFGCNVVSSRLTGFYYDALDSVAREVRCDVTDAHARAMAPQPLLDYIENELIAVAVEFSFEDSAFWSTPRFGGIAISLADSGGLFLYWGGFDLVLNGDEGVPELTTFTARSTSLTVARYVGDRLTDSAAGPATLSLERQAWPE